MRKVKVIAISTILLTGVFLFVPAMIEPVGLQPIHSKSSIRIYGANVWGMRGQFAVHTWIATKSQYEDQYTIHQIIGWRIRRNGTALSVHSGNPDDPWFRNPAILLHEVSGERAEQLIPAVRQAARSYPFARQYTMFPGPNSNSFTEWVAQEVPELGLNLPIKAIGRIWMKLKYDGLKQSANDQS